MNERQSNLRDFSAAMSSARVMRRYKLDQVLSAIQADEQLFKKEPIVDWSLLGDIERQCGLLDQLLSTLNQMSDNR